MLRLAAEYLGRYRSRLGGGLLCTVLATGFALTTPWFLRQAIDTFAGSPTALGWPLEAFAGAIVAVALADAVSRFWARYLVTGASRQVEYDLRNRYFAHLETLEPAFFQRYRTGDLVARATNDLGAVRQMFGPALYHVCQTTVLFLAAMALMFGLSPTLATWSALVLPMAMLVFIATRLRIERGFTRVQEQFSAMADHAQETFAGERVVKAYAQEQAEVETFRRTSQEYVKRQVAQIRLTGLLWPAMTLVVGLLQVILLYVGGREVVEARLTLGEFVQFNTYVAMLAWPTMALGWVATMLQQGTASLRRIQEVLDSRPTIVDGARGFPGGKPEASVEFRGVSLTLGDREILHAVNLHIPAGATYAIVGHLGSGKSSLVSLIGRLHDPTVGQVLVDGTDVRDLQLDELRRQVAYVPQETFLFSGTLRDNVAFGIPDDAAAEARVREAVRLSQLERDLDQWPAGLDTRVGERGVMLSGGQKQRVAIARAIARSPAILVLDDALSSVDTRTEEAILDGLRGFMAQRTSIVIAHRLSTVRAADRVIVLHEGRIAEQGTHAELVRRGGLYTQMYRRQLIAQELEVDDEEEAQGAARQQPNEAPASPRAPHVGWQGSSGG